MATALLLTALTALQLSAAAQEPPGPSFTPGERRFHTLCYHKKFDIDQVVADSVLRRDLPGSPVDEARALRDYLVCRKLQNQQPECSALEGLGGAFEGFGKFCQTRAEDYRFLSLALRGGDAAASCRGQFERAGKGGPAVDRQCAAVIAAVRATSLAEACAALRRESLLDAKKPCEDVAAYWPSAPKDCDRAPNEGAKQDCLEKLSLLTGLRTPAKCAASPHCQALSSQAKDACGALSRKFAAAVCARVAKAAAEAAKPQEKDPESRKSREEKAQLETSLRSEEIAAAAREKAKAEEEAKKGARAEKPQYEPGAPMKAPIAEDIVKEALEKKEREKKAAQPAPDAPPKKKP